MSEIRMLLDEIRELKRRLQALETRQEHPGYAASDVARLSVDNTFAGVIGLVEMTAPSAPSANGVFIYAQDNGVGKTELMALFSSGAAQQIAIQP